MNNRSFDLSREAIAARELLEAVRFSGELIADDEQLVLESETNIVEALAEAVSDLAELEALCDGLKEVMRNQGARLARFQHRYEVIREAIKRAFEDAELPSPMVLPEATLSIGKGRRKVHVLNEDDIPREFMRFKAPEPNLAAIGLALGDGREVPGTTLGNAQPVLTIKRS